MEANTGSSANVISSSRPLASARSTDECVALTPITRGNSGEAKAGVTNEEAKRLHRAGTRMCGRDLGDESPYDVSGSSAN